MAKPIRGNTFLQIKKQELRIARKHYTSKVAYSYILGVRLKLKKKGECIPLRN